MIAEGFEPSTVCLEGRCSIQLSYATISEIHLILFDKLTLFNLSGWQDSNLRPPRPKRGAITGLRYTPKFAMISYKSKAERQGLEPWRQLPVDRLAICSITTLAPLLALVVINTIRFASANIELLINNHNVFSSFF